MGDGTHFDDALLGLRGFRVTAVTDDGDELLVGIETIRQAAGCPACGVIARTKDRLRVVVRDLPVFGRRVKLVWSKRRFSCPEPDCPQRTLTECSDELPDRHVLSARAARECTRLVGEEARSVASLARWLGVAWATVMGAVRHYGTPLVDDPERVGLVRSLGIDETAFLKANPEHPTQYVTGFVDLERHVIVDVISGNRAIDVNRWLARRDEAFLAAVRTVACDLHEGYRSGLHPYLDHALTGRRSLPRRRRGEPLPRRGAPACPEPGARPPRSQGRPALQDPPGAAHRIRTPERPRRRPHGARAAPR